MKKSLFCLLASFLTVAASVLSAQDESEVSDEVVLELYDGARVADVVDGLATVGYIGVGVMDPAIATLWRGMWYSRLSTEPFQEYIKPLQGTGLY